MSGFGSLAGFGGMGGPNYPKRMAAPTSENVDWMPNYTDWDTDWQRRYAEEAAKARAPELIGMGMVGPTNDHGAAWSTGAYDPNQDGYIRMAADGSWAEGVGGHTMAGWTITENTPTGPGTVTHEEYGPGYTPDFTALNAERDEMIPKFENQQRYQQAYNGMAGFGLQDGMISPEYSAANFGKIDGELPSTTPLGAVPGQPGQAVNMDWAEQAFADGNQLGVYSPTGAATPTRWRI